MPDENVDKPAVETPPVPEKPADPTQRERLEAIYDKAVTSEAGAEEPAATEKPAAEGAPEKVNPDGSAKSAVEPTPNVEPEKLVVTAEQLADSKYWGGLDKDGWERMERDHPVETKLVKAAQAAATRIVNGARKEAPPPPAEERHEAPTDDEPSAELLAAVEMSHSLDDREAAKGHLLIAKLTAATVLKEGGIDPAKAKADATLTEAILAAREQLPALSGIDLRELDEIAEEHPALKALAETGTPRNLTIALVEAGKIHVDRKKAADVAAKAAADKAAADSKKKETQKVVQSNASPATAGVLKPHGAKPDTRTQRERLNDAADREIARQAALNH